ncbi:flagellin lysine-N-methylase [Paenibacillus sp. S-38]|uniref:flagellin lysine-N-methylase n=1 Tax=Paenibacillus sp. S-38 TaxID=3416710 RepID=UPI003CEAE97F
MTAWIETLFPEYVSRFTCIGGACEDTCCSGWTVNIDEATYKKYNKVKHPEFKSALEQNVIPNTANPSKNFAARMKLEHSKCSFLNTEGWCSIQLKLGEDYLCNTCSIYPRRFNKVNGVMEQSLSVSCPEAARVVMLNQEGIGFEQGKGKASSFKEITSTVQTRSGAITDWKQLFDEYRYVTIAILQNRSHSLEERLLILGMLFNELNECVSAGKLGEIPDVLGNYLRCTEDGTLQGAFDHIAKRLDIQLRICRELVVVRLNQSISSARYLECSREMMSGLGLQNHLTDRQMEEMYEQAYAAYYEPFMREHEYMLENYLVNYVFKNCMPLDSAAPFESYTRMIMHYSLIKAHLVGMAGYHQGLDTDLVIKLVQSISKTFEHNTEYFEKVMQLVKESGFMTLPYISILIKN